MGIISGFEFLEGENTEKCIYFIPSKLLDFVFSLKKFKTINFSYFKRDLVSPEKRKKIAKTFFGVSYGPAIICQCQKKRFLVKF